MRASSTPDSTSPSSPPSGDLGPDTLDEEGMQMEFYPCKPDIFAATYEPAETAPADGEHS